jgi:hypothetical protein
MSPACAENAKPAAATRAANESFLDPIDPDFPVIFVFPMITPRPTAGSGWLRKPPISDSVLR